MYLLFDFKKHRVVTTSFLSEKISSVGIDYLKSHPSAHLIVFQSIEHYSNSCSITGFSDPINEMLFAEEDQV